MENRNVLWLWVGVVAVIFILGAALGGTVYLTGSPDNSGQDTKIQFEEVQAENGDTVIQATLQQYPRDGQLEIVLKTDSATETESFMNPSSQIGKSVVIGDEIPGGVKEGQVIEVIEVRSNGGVIMTYTIEGKPGSSQVESGSTTSEN